MSLRQWSSEIYTAEFKELQASSLCVSRDGQLGVLAGRRNIALINMDEPKELVKKASRTSRWEVGGAQWNPNSQYSNHIALFSNDKIEIYVWDNSDFSTDEPIRGHTRQVSDIHWNPKEPNLLASSSLDGNIHVWDLRDLKKPCQSYQRGWACQRVEAEVPQCHQPSSTKVQCLWLLHQQHAQATTSCG